jgi:hypothetical protein
MASAITIAPTRTAPTPTPTPTIVASPTATPSATVTATAVAATGHTYYVAPGGSDAAPGTLAQPWASFYHAATSLQAGDTAIFGDGTYNETQYRAYTAFANSGSGTPGQSDYRPITIRAANPRKAVLNFSNKPGGVNSTAIWIGASEPMYARKNIIIRGMVLTQPSMGSNYSDGLVRCWLGSDNCQLIDDVFENAYEPVKFSGNTGSTLDSSLFLAANVHFGAVGATRPIIRYNEFQNPTDDAIQTKGGTTDAQVYGNLVHTLSGGPAMSVGIYLGGGSCGSACGVANVSTGYEGDHVVAWDNIVVGAIGAPAAYGGVVLEGCNICTAANNVVVNANVSVRIIANGGWPQADGRLRYVPSVSPVIMNQIAQVCTNSVFYSGGPTPGPNDLVGTATIDHSDFYSCGSFGSPAQAHPVVGNPAFVDPFTDWHLLPGSPGKGSGTTVVPANTSGQSVNIAFTRTGSPRTTPWDLGVY